MNVETTVNQLSKDDLFTCMRYYYSLPADIRMCVANRVFAEDVNFAQLVRSYHGMIGEAWITYSMAKAQYTPVLASFFRNNKWKIQDKVIPIQLESVLLTPSHSLMSFKEAVMKLEKVLVDAYRKFDIRNSRTWDVIQTFVFLFIYEKEMSMHFLTEKFPEVGEEAKMQKLSTIPSFLTMLETIPNLTPDKKKEQEVLFYTALGYEDLPEKGIYQILNELSAVDLRDFTGELLKDKWVPKDRPREEEVELRESAEELFPQGLDQPSVLSDNMGRVNLFGANIFPPVDLIDIKNDILFLNRDTISEFFPGHPETTKILFEISPEMKMMLQEELTPKICTAQVLRGRELDMVTLIEYEGEPYLLFRKSDNPEDVYGISLNRDGNSRELINISGDSEFSYRFIINGEDFTNV